MKDNKEIALILCLREVDEINGYRDDEFWVSRVDQYYSVKDEEDTFYVWDIMPRINYADAEEQKRFFSNLQNDFKTEGLDSIYVSLDLLICLKKHHMYSIFKSMIQDTFGTVHILEVQFVDSRTGEIRTLYCYSKIDSNVNTRSRRAV